MVLHNFLLVSRILSIIFVFIVVFLDKRKPESTIAWVLFLIFLPYVGVILYIWLSDILHIQMKSKEKKKFSNNKRYKRLLLEQMKYLNSDKASTRYPDISDFMLLNNNADSLITTNNEVKVYNRGIDKYNDLFNDLKNAKQFIHISYYIIKRDEYGKRLKDILIEKAKAGVEVRLIFDHIGSKVASTHYFKDLIKVGGKVEIFFPSTLIIKPYMNHRNHRKMVIIDGEIGYTGGMNIGKEYCNEDKRIYPWADRHLRIYGEGVGGLQMQFFFDYLFVSKEKIDLESKEIFNKYFPKVNSKGDKMLQIVASGPDYSQENIKNAYLKMINIAKESIIIETPYLILDDSMMDAINLACKSGVDVKVIIPGVPDKKFVYSVTLSYARELIKMGVKVYAYKGFMHSKVVVVDDLITSIGSANMDRRSFSLNFEINTFVYSKEINMKNREIIEYDIAHSEFLNETIKKKKRFGLWLERILRLLAPIM